MTCGRATAGPIRTERETKVLKPLLHFQFQAQLLKNSWALGAFQAELRRSLEKPLARALREAGACAFGAEERTLPWAGGEL